MQDNDKARKHKEGGEGGVTRGKSERNQNKFTKNCLSAVT